MIKTLWLYRPLLNWLDIYQWGADQGLKKLIPPDELHMTLATCRTPVDWRLLELDPEGLTISAGYKLVQIFGFMAKGIAFGNDRVSGRHRALSLIYPSMDHPDILRPHVTIMRGGKMPKGSYDGELVFGPEIAQEFNDEAARNVKHAKIADVLESQKD